MMNKRLLYCVIATIAIGAVLFLWANPAEAGPDSDRGWSVTQDGKTAHYSMPGGWRADPGPSNLVLTHAKDHVQITYYGSFMVTERRR